MLKKELKKHFNTKNVIELKEIYFSESKLELDFDLYGNLAEDDKAIDETVLNFLLKIKKELLNANCLYFKIKLFNNQTIVRNITMSKRNIHFVTSNMSYNGIVNIATNHKKITYKELTIRQEEDAMINDKDYLKLLNQIKI